ncbi:MAG TPA: FAD-dependent oxidoreductase [Gaiellaceae bacterium]|nr:FAD-dependent oxidoreductase [Gaiellaceae bacterium]
MKHIVILGAGFAGLELATRLSESLAGEVRVTLIDENDSFTFGFSKLDVLFGRKPKADVLLPYSEISKEGVEFRQERVTAIDPGTRRVTTDAGSYDADILVVALGAAYDFAATPGFEEGGVEYYSVAGAERMCDVLAGFDSGRILIGILGHPFKCPPAPFEGALLLHDHFVERGLRDAVEIRVAGPMAAPVPITEELSRSFLDALTERDIEYLPDRHIAELDTHEKEARLADGGGIPYDLFVGIPVHRAPQVVLGSGLADDGWVPVERGNLATRFPDVYAVGDVAALPMAKAGVFAEAAARVVAEDIAARLHGEELKQPYEGAGMCYLEFGGGAVGVVEANFFGGPEPTARLVGPSPALAAEKVEFASTRRARWF